MNYIFVYTTFPQEGEAKKIARKLLEERLCVCVNIFPLHSLYLWEGKIEKNREWGAIIKTKKNLYPSLEKYLSTLHPYQVPAILGWEIKKIASPYQKWMEETLEKRK